MARSMRGLAGGRAMVVRGIAAPDPRRRPAGRRGGCILLVHGDGRGQSVADRIVEPFTQANPAGDPVSHGGRALRRRPHPAEAGQASATDPGPHACAWPPRGRAGARPRRGAPLDGHTYTAALVRAEAAVRCRAGRAGRLELGGRAGAADRRRRAVRRAGPRTITLADGTEVLLDEVCPRPGRGRRTSPGRRSGSSRPRCRSHSASPPPTRGRPPTPAVPEQPR